MHKTSWLVISMLALAACGDDGGGGTPDAGMTPDAVSNFPDAMVDAADDPDAMVDATPPVDADTSPSGLLRSARLAADGAVNLPINGAFVTFKKAAVGNDLAGFFVQAEQAGPALFIAVDPTALTPEPAIGDEVSFDITTMATVGMLRMATAITSFAVASSANDISGLVQDVSAATDLVSAIGDYESELITLTATISDDFGSQGTGHVAAAIETAGITGDTNLRLRVPTTLAESLDLTQGCTIAIHDTPMWRFNATAQVSAWTAADITPSNCPAPTVVSAAAPDGTSVVVTFDRQIEPTSVQPDGSQFTIDNGVTVSAAAVSGKTVTLTTSLQIGGTSYTVTVADTVTDTTANAVVAPNNTATFTGFVTLAVVRINEVNANIAQGCDLIELLVISGGTMDGFTLRAQGTLLLTFSAFNVQAADLVVVHLNGDSATCNPNAAGNETAAVDELPQSAHPLSYDTAYDWYPTGSGIGAITNVVRLQNNLGTIIDAVFLANDGTEPVAGTTETAAAAVANAGEWQMVGGGVPAGGFVGDDFRAHAVQGLGSTGTDPSGESIQRNDDDDNNDLADWTQAASSWGALNAGQTAP